MLDGSMSTLIARRGWPAHDVDQPGVQRWRTAASSSARALTDSGMRERDPGDVAVVLPASSAGGGGAACSAAGAGGAVDDERELAAVEPDVHAARGHLRGDLGGGLADRLHQAGRAAGRARTEALGDLAGLGPATSAAATRSQRRPSTYGVMSMHHYDITMTSCQHRDDITWW